MGFKARPPKRILDGRTSTVTRDEALAIFAQLTRDRPEGVHVKQLPGDLYAALLRLCGSIRAARDAIGAPAPPRPRSWSPDAVLSEMRALDRRNRPITEHALLTSGRADLLGAARRYFGGVARARDQAGLDPPRTPSAPRRQWDPLEVVRVIQHRHRQGHELASTRVPRALADAARRHWGTWQRAIEAAGLDYDATRLTRRPWTKTELLTEFRRLADAQPQMTLGDLRNSPLSEPATTLFGSLDRAIQIAATPGWPVRKRDRRQPTKAALRRALRERRERGEPITATAVRSASRRLHYRIASLAPTWNEALAVLGFKVDP